ncbi:transketolase [Trinickia soli]|uniref:transketolase n=1 Tax=Trinickia soli TaxID=380675 RepID=UPI001257DB12|nr:transketolase [Paraburkholderia sp. T12-10]
MMTDTIELARRLRIHALNMVHRAGASHIASALSICDLVAVLYARVLNVDPAQPAAPQRDRFILSKGHACVAVYAALAERGFIEEEDLTSYGQVNSPLMNHISHAVPGVEFSTGSLGHGLPFGAGKAAAGRRRNAAWRVFVLMSDGELDEGSNWEAMMFAAHHRLDNLVAIIDYNKLQSLTSIAATLGIEPMGDKLRAFGWCVREVDGHDHEAIAAALAAAPWEPGKPSMLVAHTTKGKGVSYMENRVEWHYRTPNSEQLAAAIEALRG